MEIEEKKKKKKKNSKENGNENENTFEILEEAAETRIDEGWDQETVNNTNKNKGQVRFAEEDIVLRDVKSTDFENISILKKNSNPTYSGNKKQLQEWFSGIRKQFLLIYRSAVIQKGDNGDMKAVAAFLPLKEKVWWKITTGQMEESQIKEEHLIDEKTKDLPFGLHLFHFEKASPLITNFHVRMLHDLKKILDDKNFQRVIGFSSYCCTEESTNLMYNKLNCFERYYYSSAYVFTKNDKVNIKTISNGAELRDHLNVGNILKTRCKMLSSIIGEPSFIWIYLSDTD